MVPGDGRNRWPGKLLTDSRVTHYWDEERVLGRWYGRIPEFGNDNPVVRDADDPILWDAFFLYGAGSVWEERPTELVAWGAPVIRKSEALKKGVARLD